MIHKFIIIRFCEFSKNIQKQNLIDADFYNLDKMIRFVIIVRLMYM